MSPIPRRTVCAVVVTTALAGATPPIGGPLTTVAKGPTVIGDTFNGGTTVCVSTEGAACSTNGS
ncbi:MAG TPA: hypothetical protein VG371_15545 [Solirubrobacteraceae bacterium]|jgi:hypothetical protein|nr:hypothetical protein [Solirubrobacteraceae bacterium]